MSRWRRGLSPLNYSAAYIESDPGYGSFDPQFVSQVELSQADVETVRERVRRNTYEGKLAIAPRVWRVAAGENTHGYVTELLRGLRAVQAREQDAAYGRAVLRAGFFGLPDSSQDEQRPAWIDFRTREYRDNEGNTSVYVATGVGEKHDYTHEQMDELMQQWAVAAGGLAVSEQPLQLEDVAA